MSSDATGSRRRAFYMSPGHAPAAEAGTELIQFSPADQLAATTAAIKKAMS